MRSYFVLALIIALVLPSLSFADGDTPNYTRPGHYATLSAGRANNSFDKDADLAQLYRPRNQTYETTRLRGDFRPAYRRYFFTHCDDEGCWSPKFRTFETYQQNVVETGDQFNLWHRTTAEFSDSFVYGGSLGYRFNPIFAVELHGERIKGFRSQGLSFSENAAEAAAIGPHPTYEYEQEGEDDEPEAVLKHGDRCIRDCEAPLDHTQLARKDHELQGFSGTVMGKIFLPLGSGRFQPFVMAGAGLVNMRLSGPNTSDGHQLEVLYRAGGGFDFYLNENLVIGTEIAKNNPGGDLRDFDFWTATTNLTYRFK